MKTIISWSGGKDSCYAMLVGLEQGYKPVAFITAVEDAGKYSRSNGVSLEILQAQARVMGVPLFAYSTSWNEYEQSLVKCLGKAARETGATHCIFGDIDIAPHREFEEKVCCASGLLAILPLWNRARTSLAAELIAAGVKAKITVVRRDLNIEDILCREYDDELLCYLAKCKNVDVCGENGEFHTMVYACAAFKHSIDVELDTVLSLNDTYKSAFYKLQ